MVSGSRQFFYYYCKFPGGGFLARYSNHVSRALDVMPRVWDLVWLQIEAEVDLPQSRNEEARDL